VIRLLCTIFLLSMSLMASAESSTKKYQKNEKEVIRLINSLTVAKQQPIAIKQLEKMGKPIVALIIKHMDDRRLLGMRYVEFENKAINAFEEHRIYKPEQVVDILAGLLNQLTGESYGDIYSGGHDFQRDEVVFKWREWCANSLKAIPKECNSNFKADSTK
jgi:hypothetical protein